mmetsp:Transcript_21997/g.50573  ORF Transcript_21997/g.50573 Transcript_21997/m.50573 type:complete len:242 (+) Transcript_21997:110-835(+)
MSSAMRDALGFSCDASDECERGCPSSAACAENASDARAVGAPQAKRAAAARRKSAAERGGSCGGGTVECAAAATTTAGASACVDVEYGAPAATSAGAGTGGGGGCDGGDGGSGGAAAAGEKDGGGGSREDGRACGGDAGCGGGCSGRTRVRRAHSRAAGLQRPACCAGSIQPKTPQKSTEATAGASTAGVAASAPFECERCVTTSHVGPLLKIMPWTLPGAPSTLAMARLRDSKHSPSGEM